MKKSIIISLVIVVFSCGAAFADGGAGSLWQAKEATQLLNKIELIANVDEMVKANYQMVLNYKNMLQNTASLDGISWRNCTEIANRSRNLYNTVGSFIYSGKSNWENFKKTYGDIIPKKTAEEGIQVWDKSEQEYKDFAEETCKNFGLSVEDAEDDAKFMQKLAERSKTTNGQKETLDLMTEFLHELGKILLGIKHDLIAQNEYIIRTITNDKQQKEMERLNELSATQDREHWVKSDVPFIYMNRQIK